MYTADQIFIRPELRISKRDLESRAGWVLRRLIPWFIGRGVRAGCEVVVVDSSNTDGGLYWWMRPLRPDDL